MKLPTGIKTRNKIRDLAIIHLYVNKYWTFKALGKKFGISDTRVHQIVQANSHLVERNKALAKTARINHLERLLEEHPSRIGNNTTLDIIDQIRKEDEGDKGNTVDLSKHSYFTVIVKGTDGTIPENNRIFSASEPDKSIQ